MSEENKKINEKCHIVSSPTATKHTVYLNDVIFKFEDYIDLLDKLKGASNKDVFEFRINNRGGLMDISLQICEYINKTSAHTIAVLEGCCASAATFIFFSCKEKKVLDTGYMMIHYYSTHLPAMKGCDAKLQIDFVEKHAKIVFTNLYTPFLSKKEIESMFAGKDYWFMADEVRKRLK